MEVREPSAKYLVRSGYKQTEVGMIPEDWSLKPFAGIATTVASGRSSVDAEFGDFPVYGSTGMIGRSAKGDYAGRAILVARVGANAGTLNVVDGEYGVTDNTIIVRVSDSVLLSYVWRQLDAKRLNSMVFGSGQPLITGTQIKNLLIPFPPTKAEQEAIAEALGDADTLIESLEQLLAKKRNLKQGTMQELLTGKKRLPGFSGEWGVKRLRNVGNCLRGVTYRGDNDLSLYDTANTNRLLRSNNVQNATVVTTDIQFVNAARVSENQLLRENDILICMANGSKALVGKSGFFKVSDGYEYTFGAFMGCFRTNSVESNSTFVFLLFQTGRYRNHINNLLAGSSINNLSPSNIESFEFSIPPLPEQTAIAAILSDMDAEIAALEAKLAKARSLKQGMMQELLTGRIRLV